MIGITFRRGASFFQLGSSLTSNMTWDKGRRSFGTVTGHGKINPLEYVPQNFIVIALDAIHDDDTVHGRNTRRLLKRTQPIIDQSDREERVVDLATQTVADY